MNKIVYLLFFSFSALFSAEPTLGILHSINSNTQQVFTIAQKRYVCDAYGILGLEKLLENSSINSACKTKIQKFYLKNPEARSLSFKKLHIFSQYHLEFKESQCILFASGEITLSELLLKEGFALLEPLFDDEEYVKYYKNAQELAKFEKRGLWEDGTKECAAELYKK